MFIFGFLVGVGVVLGLLYLLRAPWEEGQASALLARHRIHSIERQAIEQMLDEAEIGTPVSGRITLPKDKQS